MFQALQNKLENAFKKIRGRGSLSSSDIEIALKEVRMALLEADVNFKVAKDLCANIAAKAQGEEILKSLTPGQQVIKIVHEELSAILGGEAVELNLKVAPPAIIMLVGLQGSGKTTTCAKLARLLEHDYKRKVLLVPADIYRPAAIQQLKTLGKQLDITVYDSNSTTPPTQIASAALEYAKNHAFDCLILDTAGRLQIDELLMQELKDISQLIHPHEILLVADAMTGQESVNVATGFSQALPISGLVLTKLDGDARGGAALSMLAVTGKPIKFIGIGEKSDALEVFHPSRMSSRILGMGDVLSLIEKASREVNLEESLELQNKLKKNQFDLEDFLSQLNMLKRMGSLSSIAGMIPGLGKMMSQVNEEDSAREMKHVEAIILSMTPKERRNPGIINGSRRKRIAKGSGTQVEQVNRLLKQFLEMKKMISKFSKIPGLGKMMGGQGMNPLALLKNLRS